MSGTREGGLEERRFLVYYLVVVDLNLLLTCYRSVSISSENILIPVFFVS